MDLLIGFIVFIGAMVWCIITGYTMVIALFIGLIAFTIVGKRKGFALSEIAKMGADGLKDALIVIEIMFIIGFITAVWRSAGTISFFVYYGIKMITPAIFLIITFALCCLLSYALGTSFGVAGTVGVIFIALARAGGVDEFLTAGAVMSGIYFGDRGSPVSSSAILVATITETELLANVKRMAKTAWMPLVLTLGIYSVLSFTNPIQTVDQSFLHNLESEFSLSIWAVVPALCMLVLPLLKVPVIYAMLVSIASGSVVSLFCEDMSLQTLLHTLIFGYTGEGGLGKILDGGGMLSMIEIVCIVSLSSTYSGIFTGTDMLGVLQEKILFVAKKIGRFPTMVLISYGFLGIFCNQTIASMMCCDFLKKPYEALSATKEELAIDLENSVILLAGTVPWAIACTVPLGFMQVGIGAITFSFYLYLVPICYGIQKKVSNPFTKE
ncbi:MAG: sodium:proton antiporter [Emergencia sp.]|uniref:Na+/H+ antiporter NhaC family protein n=1 Tax=Senimuribacter intestinalis TaxID=2941507 RepID=UPI0020407B70|nr:Na+/H+ antiporter NhaC family protein [Senimuribacter intestinalis]MCI9641016.1 sodium:proton antiporter [Emergencia sp.]